MRRGLVNTGTLCSINSCLQLLASSRVIAVQVFGTELAVKIQCLLTKLRSTRGDPLSSYHLAKMLDDATPGLYVTTRQEDVRSIVTALLAVMGGAEDCWAFRHRRRLVCLHCDLDKAIPEEKRLLVSPASLERESAAVDSCCGGCGKMGLAIESFPTAVPDVMFLDCAAEGSLPPKDRMWVGGSHYVLRGWIERLGRHWNIGHFVTMVKTGDKGYLCCDDEFVRPRARKAADMRPVLAMYEKEK